MCTCVNEMITCEPDISCNGWMGPESQNAKGASTLKRIDFTWHTQFANLTGNILTHQIMGLVIDYV